MGAQGVSDTPTMCQAVCSCCAYSRDPTKALPPLHCGSHQGWGREALSSISECPVRWQVVSVVEPWARRWQHEGRLVRLASPGR